MKWLKNDRKDRGADVELINAQRERIEVLKADVLRLEKELESYRQRERSITEVLSFAKERASDYEREAKLRYNLERERLSAYREKWQKRLAELGNAERLGEEVIECNEYFKHISNELRSIVEGDNAKEQEPSESFYSEVTRLKNIGVSSADEVTLSESDLNKLLLQFRDS